MTSPRASLSGSWASPASTSRPSLSTLRVGDVLVHLAARDAVDGGPDPHVALADPGGRRGAQVQCSARRPRSRLWDSPGRWASPASRRTGSRRARSRPRSTGTGRRRGAPARARARSPGWSACCPSRAAGRPARRAAWRPPPPARAAARPDATDRRWACAGRPRRPPDAASVPASQSTVGARRRVCLQGAVAIGARRARAPGTPPRRAAAAITRRGSDARYSHSIVAGRLAT